MASYSETLNYIFNLRGGEIDLRLNRVEQALSLFDHPERKYPALHIAGTNGKGSTAAMLHRILCLQGYRVALYTSPHVVSFTERMRIGEEEISQEEVVELAESLKRRLAREKVSLTFFEFVTVIAFIYFARRKVDLAVVEVGLGGRLDATNVVMPRVSVVTTISKDHEAYLGSDLLSIAREKGGIIKSGVPVVGGSFSPDVRELLKEIAEAKGSTHFFLGQDFSFVLKDKGLFDYKGLKWNLKDLSLALRGRHQRSNAALALGALEAVAGEVSVSEAAVREGLATVFWPGRFEVIRGRPTVILDGAHNVEGIKALVEGVRDFAGNKKVKILFAAMGDKNSAAMLSELSAVASEMILTRVPMARSADPRILLEAVPQGVLATIVDQPGRALNQMLRAAEADQTILVAGSLYLLGQVRPLLAEMFLGKFPQGEIAGGRV
jgi:dihydrofolate synthase / folylpolyglutamate synthase